MTQELVMAVVANDCECTLSGECICAVDPDGCMCECECEGCETEYVAEVCACGGNCGCASAETYWN